MLLVAAAAVVGVGVLALSACSSTPTGSAVAAPAEPVASPLASTALPTVVSSPSRTGALPAGCRLTTPRADGKGAIYDYVDFVMVGSTTYISSIFYDRQYHVEPTPASEIGPVVATVRCRFEDIPHDYAPPKQTSGDAAFLDPGTELHSARGYDVTCRVVIRHGSKTRAYLAQDPTARTSTPKKCALRPAR